MEKREYEGFEWEVHYHFLQDGGVMVGFAKGPFYGPFANIREAEVEFLGREPRWVVEAPALPPMWRKLPDGGFRYSPRRPSLEEGGFESEGDALRAHYKEIDWPW